MPKFAKKGAKVKIRTRLDHCPPGDPLSGGVSSRSNHNRGVLTNNNTTANYSQKTFYSAYIGANSLKQSQVNS